MKCLKKALRDANEWYSHFKSSQTLVQHSGSSVCPSSQTDKNVGKCQQISHENKRHMSNIFTAV
jgi:hypothetical protein